MRQATATTGEYAASYKAGITKNNTGNKLQRESQQATHAASNNSNVQIKKRKHLLQDIQVEIHDINGT
jgi:hypothetical protein